MLLIIPSRFSDLLVITVETTRDKSAEQWLVELVQNL
jgi:hypothetical protein